MTRGDFNQAYIVVKGDIPLTKAANRDFIDLTNRFLHLKTMHYLLIVYQRPIMY